MIKFFIFSCQFLHYMVNVHKVSAPIPQYTDTLVEVPIKSSGLSTLANLKDQNTLCWSQAVLITQVSL